ncbi:MAG TPA: Tol-Pal system beta propeller repeat protein TolB [Thermodesulfobacteriota bacterium]|nr:Tol-Pal system beta propeller repeat protein TolB [Thermodesulfobacteriota bacterium]
MKRVLTFFFLLGFLVPSPAEARIYFDINAPTFVQIPIVLPRWKAVDKTPSSFPEKVYEILANDLTLSGFFKVIDVNRLPPPLQERDGIPSASALQEWTPAGGEILLAGETLLEPNGLTFNMKFHLFDLVEQKHIVGKQYEGHLQTLRSAVHRMADEIVLQITGEKGVHNTRIAYVLLQGPGKEICIADFDGANVKQITQNKSINLSPAWAPEGKRIAFTSYLRRNPDLYLIDVDGKNVQLFSRYPGLNVSPSWSPDGKKIALMMGMEGKSDIYLIDPDGGSPKKLTKGHGNEASPTWSPDGESIAFVSDRSGAPQIYVMARDGSNVRRLTFEGSYNTNPSWSPKGDRIAFCSRTEGRFEIFSIGTDGSGLRRLTANSGNNENPSWSPDGRYIAFSSTRTGASKIFIMNANGFNQRALTPSKGGESSPAWSRRFE